MAIMISVIGRQVILVVMPIRRRRRIHTTHDEKEDKTHKKRNTHRIIITMACSPVG